jgi:hypothetical protein
MKPAVAEEEVIRIPCADVLHKQGNFDFPRRTTRQAETISSLVALAGKRGLSPIAITLLILRHSKYG